MIELVVCALPVLMFFVLFVCLTEILCVGENLQICCTKGTKQNKGNVLLGDVFSFDILTVCFCWSILSFDIDSLLLLEHVEDTKKLF